MGRSWWGLLGWAATAAVIVFAASLWKENSTLRQSLASANAQAVESTRELEELRRVAAPIVAPDAQRVTLVAVKTPPQPQGKAFYLRNRSSLVFVANNMPALPPQKAYELWLIPAQWRADSGGSVQARCAWQCDGRESSAARGDWRLRRSRLQWRMKPGRLRRRCRS